MRSNRFVRFLKVALFVVLIASLLGFVVQGLWNWLTPALFGWHVITFWQALGILILSKILFAGFRGGPHGHRHWRYRMIERWGAMTPEEREKFREAMLSRCGFQQDRAPETKA
jgi:hypothetical protein